MPCKICGKDHPATNVSVMVDGLIQAATERGRTPLNLFSLLNGLIDEPDTDTDEPLTDDERDDSDPLFTMDEVMMLARVTQLAAQSMMTPPRQHRDRSDAMVLFSLSAKFSDLVTVMDSDGAAGLTFKSVF